MLGRPSSSTPATDAEVEEIRTLFSAQASAKDEPARTSASTAISIGRKAREGKKENAKAL